MGGIFLGIPLVMSHSCLLYIGIYILQRNKLLTKYRFSFGYFYVIHRFVKISFIFGWIFFLLWMSLLLDNTRF
ncbi:hypothetical protein BZA77DRAFT_311771 [Pyronema omphalodes]|nr:hypothetical protein BZA77DRAFT_311771 [Pyronema omphalodes]